MDRFENILLPCKLTKDELIEYATQLSQLIEESNDLEAEKASESKRLKEAIDGKEAAISRISKIVKAGRIERPVECHWEYNYGDNIKTLTRTDTGEVVKTLPLTIADKQKTLNFSGIVADIDAQAAKILP